MRPRMGSYFLHVFLTFMFLIIILAGCSKPAPVTFNLEATPILSGGLGWAVVSDAYVRLKIEPGFESTDGDYARRGDILQVVATERSFSGRNRGTWYKLEGDDTGGWLHQSLLAVYPSLDRASKAAKTESQNVPVVAP
jgi:hypothetical protein